MERLLDDVGFNEYLLMWRRGETLPQVRNFICAVRNEHAYCAQCSNAMFAAAVSPHPQHMYMRRANAARYLQARVGCDTVVEEFVAQVQEYLIDNLSGIARKHTQ